MKTKHYTAITALVLALTTATPAQGQSHYNSDAAWQQQRQQQAQRQQQYELERQREQLERQQQDLRRLQDAQRRAKREADNDAYYCPPRPVLPDRFTVPSERHAPGVRDYYTPSTSRPAYGGYYFRRP